MNKISFVLPVLLLSIFFIQCSKNDSKPNLNTHISTLKTGNRTPCQVDIYPLTYATLTYCGVETNATACSTCLGDSKGLEVVTGDASFVLNGPTSFSISSAMATSVILVTDQDQIGPISIPANGCEVFTLDDNCKFQ